MNLTIEEMKAQIEEYLAAEDRLTLYQGRLNKMSEDEIRSYYLELFQAPEPEEPHD